MNALQGNLTFITDKPIVLNFFKTQWSLISENFKTLIHLSSLY